MTSDARAYRLELPRIAHEYILLWRRPQRIVAAVPRPGLGGG
jgi:hypothetical protein